MSRLTSLFVLSSGRRLLLGARLPLGRAGGLRPGPGGRGAVGGLGGGGFLRGAAPQGRCSPGRQHRDGRGSHRERLPGRTDSLRGGAVSPAAVGAKAAAGSEQDPQGHPRAAGRAGGRTGKRGGGPGGDGFGFPLSVSSNFLIPVEQEVQMKVLYL